MLIVSQLKDTSNVSYSESFSYYKPISFGPFCLQFWRVTRRPEQIPPTTPEASPTKTKVCFSSYVPSRMVPQFVARFRNLASTNFISVGEAKQDKPLFQFNLYKHGVWVHPQNEPFFARYDWVKTYPWAMKYFSSEELLCVITDLQSYYNPHDFDSLKYVFGNTSETNQNETVF